MLVKRLVKKVILHSVQCPVYMNKKQFKSKVKLSCEHHLPRAVLEGDISDTETHIMAMLVKRAC